MQVTQKVSVMIIYSEVDCIVTLSMPLFCSRHRHLSARTYLVVREVGGGCDALQEVLLLVRAPVFAKIQREHEVLPRKAQSTTCTQCRNLQFMSST